ncbi:histidine kinase [Nonomuraea sp. MCN248]|uniref:histidine kinase n=1 Tax=Nonomuraea corallina TaxID=2989783 RepID=A0ABT4S4C0_9ACTN|nr:histidine kinase [Nonomuraea corallina]MDA0631865.1 histidine kinase [Nonomuraea corallina]
MNRVPLWAGLAFLVGLVLIGAGARIERDVPEWLLVIPLAITCLAVLLRYRSPLGSLGLGTVGFVMDVLVGPSLGTMLVYTDNLYAAALYGPARFSRWLLAITAVTAVGFGAVTGFLWSDWRALALNMVQVGLILVTPVTTAQILRQHRDQAAAERARAEQVARLAELDRQAAITAERTRMARELHDMIANHFSAIAIQSTAALSRKDLDPATVRTIMESVRENSVKGMAEMRSMIGLLRQEGDEGEAMRHRLRDAEGLVERSRQAGLTTELRVEGRPRDLSVPVDLAAFRILQEALTNALKHGDPPARVRLAYEDDQVSITVDNPLGERDRRLPGAGAGLVGMKERANLVGGTFEAGPHENGWRVAATFPAPEGQAT